jgi:ADP-heptose:LPS heptosyltransferase
LLKNTLIKNFVALKTKMAKSPSFDEKRFLIVSTTALGDTLWGTPALRALRQTFPDAPISVLTSPTGREVLVHNPHINAIYTLKNPALRSLLSLYRPLKEGKFSHIFIFHTSQRPVLPCMALLQPEKLIGSAKINKGLDTLLTNCLTHQPHTHEIVRRLELIAQVGAKNSSFAMELFLHPDDERLAQEWLDSLSLTPGLPSILFHPGSKDVFRRWPPSHFIALGKKLKKEMPCNLFVTGIPSEKPLVEEIASQIPGAISMTHLPLRAFAALLKKMQLCITNDTGPLHIACAMNTPTIALFAATDPLLFGPYHAENVTLIKKRVTCSPCLHRKCQDSFCFLQIGVEEVYDTAHKIVRGNSVII